MKDDDCSGGPRKCDDSELEEFDLERKFDSDARRIGRKIKNQETSGIYPTETIS